ncbi:MAG: hypothetical protein KGK07_11640 [Chloroflexota bacterium]|nr:hypothetical protein [Chloroflexota bacterium]
MRAAGSRPPVALVSAAIYTSLAAAGAGLFLVVTSATGDYTAVARLGGTAWVFLLSMIILMPTVTPLVKRLFMER